MMEKKKKLEKINRLKKQQRKERNKTASLSDDLLLASGGLDYSLRVWDLCTGEELKKLNSSRIHALEWHPHRNFVGIGTGKKTVEIWDMEQGEASTEYGNHSSYVTSIEWDAEGTRIASSAGDGTARIWHFSNGNLATLKGHQDYLVTDIVWKTTDEVITSAMDQTVRQWSVENQAELAKAKLKRKTGLLARKTLTPTALAWNSEQRLLLIGTMEGDIQILDSDFDVFMKIKNAHKGAVASVTFNANGGKILSGGFDSFTKVWEVREGTFDLAAEDFSLDVKKLANHGGSVYEVDWSEDDRWVASSGKDATIVVWSTETWQPLDIRGHRSGVLSFAIRPLKK